MVKETQVATPLDAKLAELRKKLADLRADPELTKDKIEKTGLPTLEELKGVYPQWEKQAKKRQTKLANAIAQLRPLAEFLRLLEEESAKRNKPGVVGLPVGEYRDKVKELLAAINASEAEVDARVLAENARLSKGLSAEETAGVQAINALRMLCGLRPLLIDPKLCEAARGHCKDMIEKSFFAHESPVPNKKTPFDRAQLAGTTASAENIFKGSGSASEAVKGWFLSPGHHKNMLGESHKRQGLGREGVHWTSMFGD